jgi:hypothetical protein
MVQFPMAMVQFLSSMGSIVIGDSMPSPPLSPSPNELGEGESAPLAHCVGEGLGVRAIVAPLAHCVGEGLGVRAIAAPLAHCVREGLGVRAIAAPLAHCVGEGLGVRLAIVATRGSPTV